MSPDLRSTVQCAGTHTLTPKRARACVSCEQKPSGVSKPVQLYRPNAQQTWLGPPKPWAKTVCTQAANF